MTVCGRGTSVYGDPDVILIGRRFVEEMQNISAKTE